MKNVERLESNVRSYCRSFPVVFDRAEGDHLYDEDGNEYVDFFAGAGVLNYGHNPPVLRERLLDYLGSGRIVHGLDMATVAKREFLLAIEDVLLRPRDWDYVVQFPGPTGTNAVESALKLARKVTGRDSIVSFTNAFHGMTLGSLGITGNAFKRKGAGVPLSGSNCMPFDGYFGPDTDTIDYFAAFLADDGSGVDTPAAVILETVQAEGGINVASGEWLRRLERLCREYDILLVVDDIQVGCGRTGPFFSFEAAGIEPDVVCLSKSLSGYGLPLAVNLIRPELDVWEPGEHNGTFRGHNPAFVTATAALETFWRDDTLAAAVARKAEKVAEHLRRLARRFPELRPEVRGRGLVQGLACGNGDFVRPICTEAFRGGLVLETAGPDGSVLKIMPPLTIAEETLTRGLNVLERSIEAVLGAGPAVRLPEAS